MTAPMYLKLLYESVNVDKDDGADLLILIINGNYYIASANFFCTDYSIYRSVRELDFHLLIW